MAYNQKQYDILKSAYDQMNSEQRQSFVDSYKDNTDFQSFAKDYAMGWYGKSTTSAPLAQPSNPAPVENNQQNQTSPNGQNWENQKQNQSSFSENNNEQTNYNQNQTFDSSKMSNPNAQVQVQAGNAKQTWMPDYQDDSDARMGEITNNLNAYWNTNREYFADRQTFNKVFSYDKRSKAQQAHFDSFWKRKEIDKKVAGYTDWKSVSLALEEGTLTKAQLEALKIQNPKVYAEYLEDQLNKKNLDLVNTGSKSRIFNEDEQISHNTDALTDMMRKLGFDMSADGRAKELYEKFRELKNDPKIDTMKQDYLEARKIYLQRRREFNTLPDRIRAQSSWASETLISARINKAQRLAYNELQTLADEAQIRKEEYVLEYGEMKDEFNAFKEQADEDNRAFERKVKALGFAQDFMSYETPEQKKQAELEHIKNKFNLEAELSDINSKDPKIQFNAVMKALDPHYKEFGSIILRPQAQAAQDIINLAKKEGISVGEAMRKNFTEELFKKPEYIAMIGKQTGISVGQKVMNIWGKPYIQTNNPDGTVSLALYGESAVSNGDYVDVPRNINGYKDNVGADTNNPGNITNISGTVGKYKSPNGRTYAVYATVEEGYQALINDLKGKQTGNTRTGLNSNSTIEQLIGVRVNGRGSVDRNNGYYKTFIAETKLTAGTKIGDVATEILARGIMAGEGTLQAYKKWGVDLSHLRKSWTMANSEQVSYDDIISFNDDVLMRKLSSEDRQRIAEAKKKIMDNPKSDIKDILDYSMGGKAIGADQSKQFAKFSQALEGLDMISTQIAKMETWPILGKLRKLNPYDTDAQVLQTMLNGLVPTMARGVYGEVGVLTDNDVRLYAKTIPNLTSTEEVNQMILAYSLDTMASAYKNNLASLAGQGYDVSGMAGMYYGIKEQADRIKSQFSHVGIEERAKKYRWENNVLKTSGGDVNEEGFIY